MEERLYWLGFSAFPGIGPKKFSLLLDRFGRAKPAWEASLPNLRPVLGETTALRFDAFRGKFSLEDYAQELSRKSVLFLTLAESEYPKLLRETKNPPFVLYALGDKSVLRSPKLAVVGTRSISRYGQEVTEILSAELVAHGFTIVSGLALGIDATAHRAAIEQGGKTIAVLGCGVDCCYPRENQRLYDRIIESGGAVVSEVPLSHRPMKGLFPQRNRIIAGLSRGVLVTEGAEDSGALITADYARKFGRMVFAVPGPITSSLSKGPYKLIERGAKLVTSAADILEEIGITKRGGTPKSWLPLRSEASRRVKGDTKEETRILKLLANEPLHFDEIVKRTKLESAKVGTLLSLMEIKGVVKSQESGVFSIVQ